MTEYKEPSWRPPLKATEWLTVADIAIFLHVRPDTVRRWIRKEKLAAKFFGGRTGYRISGVDLQEFLLPAAAAPKKDAGREGLRIS